MKPYVIQAEIDDVMDILPLLEQFAEEYPVVNGKEHFHPKPATNLIAHAIHNGAVYIAKEGENVIGLIAGTVQCNPFTMSSMELKEICWYVTPEYRNGRVALQLYKRYTDHAQWMLDEGEVDGVWMTTTVDTPDSATKLIEKTFTRVETNFIRQEKTDAND